MNTPICDFVNQYCKKNSLRLHMPGHKGKFLIGFEGRDLTEINGADDLYHPTGIIKKSEENASSLFGAYTHYSTEGSSQGIRAVMGVISEYAHFKNRKPLVLAARNVHKTFLSAAALLDIDVEWLYSSKNTSYLSCSFTEAELEEKLSSMYEIPIALFLTTPDYLGNMMDITKISEICKKHDILLAVDNAHGAYLKFLKNSCHPIDLGADICCDSAHKTLPCITGGAYVHISKNAPKFLNEHIKYCLSLFGSTSPSYLILQSLDYLNFYIFNGYKAELESFTEVLEEAKSKIASMGYTLYGNEPLKITIKAKEYGYTGTDLAKLLEEKNIFCEFYDADFLVLMLTPEITVGGVNRLIEVLSGIKKREKIKSQQPQFSPCEKLMSIRKAVFSEKEKVLVEKSINRILAVADASCPPAVPIAVCGEKISENTIEAFKYYGVTECEVVKADVDK